MCKTFILVIITLTLLSTTIKSSPPKNLAGFLKKIKETGITGYPNMQNFSISLGDEKD